MKANFMGGKDEQLRANILPALGMSRLPKYFGPSAPLVLMDENISQTSSISSPNNLHTNLMDENVGGDRDIDAGQSIPDVEKEQTSPKDGSRGCPLDMKKDSLNLEQKSKVELTPHQA
jgi:hypothetical protein